MKHKLKVLAATSGALFALAANAQSSAQERYMGEIFWVGYSYCPRGSTEAAGQLLPISSHAALFSLFGTTYGGDGRTTFQLPDLRGRSAIGFGQGPGLSNYPQGRKGGEEVVKLSEAQMPTHDHGLHATTGRGNGTDGADLSNSGMARVSRSSANSDTVMDDDIVGEAGGSQPVDIRDPYLTIRACVAVQGMYPSRN